MAVNEAEDCCWKAADPVGLLYVALYRAQMLVARGDIAEAAALLDVLAHDPQLDRSTTLRIALVGARLWTSLASPGAGSVDEDYARYLAICQKQPSSTRDLRVYHAVGRFHAARGEWSQAEPAFRAAVAAIHDVTAAWSDPTDRSHFLKLQSPCLAEASECLRMLNKVEEAERLPGPLTSTANLQRQRHGRGGAARSPVLPHRRASDAGQSCVHRGSDPAPGLRAATRKRAGLRVHFRAGVLHKHRGDLRVGARDHPPAGRVRAAGCGRLDPGPGMCAVAHVLTHSRHDVNRTMNEITDSRR